MKKGIVRVATKEDRDNWNRLVEKSSHSSVFHLWEWGELISEVYSLRRYYLVVEQEGNLAAVLPLIYIRSMLFGDKLISLPFCEHGGLIMDSDDQVDSVSLEPLFDYVKELAARLDVDYIEVRAPSFKGNPMEKLFRSYQYQKIGRYVTFRLGLNRPLEEVWKGSHRIKRKAVRKALKSNVKVKMAQNETEMASYYGLYLETQKRLGSPPHSYDFFKAMWNKFYPSGFLQVLLAKYSDKLIGGNLVFPFHKEICWWGSATNVKYRSLNATNLLLWKTMEWGFDNHFEVFDFGRTRPGSRVYDFKRPWRGSETVLYDYMCLMKGVKPPDPSQNRYIVMSKIWGYVPEAVARKLGPRVVSRIGL